MEAYKYMRLDSDNDGFIVDAELKEMQLSFGDLGSVVVSLNTPFILAVKKSVLFVKSRQLHPLLPKGITCTTPNACDRDIFMHLRCQFEEGGNNLKRRICDRIRKEFSGSISIAPRFYGNFRDEVGTIKWRATG